MVQQLCTDGVCPAFESCVGLKDTANTHSYTKSHMYCVNKHTHTHTESPTDNYSIITELIICLCRRFRWFLREKEHFEISGCSRREPSVPTDCRRSESAASTTATPGASQIHEGQRTQLCAGRLCPCEGNYYTYELNVTL